MQQKKRNSLSKKDYWQTTLHVPILKMTFSIPLKPHQIPQFRGAIVRLVGREYDLFHNHQQQDDRYFYRFPAIQYRVESGQAVLIAFGPDAVEQANCLLGKTGQEITLKNWRQPLHLLGFQQETFKLCKAVGMQSYCLYDYLALNHDNFKKWKACNSFRDRIALLERILVAHLFSFGAGLGWTIEKPLAVCIQEIRRIRMVKCFGTGTLSFNLSYQTNLQLPSGIALGRVTSHGFGVQHPFAIPKSPGENPRNFHSIQQYEKHILKTI